MSYSLDAPNYLSDRYLQVGLELTPGLGTIAVEMYGRDSIGRVGHLSNTAISLTPAGPQGPYYVSTAGTEFEFDLDATGSDNIGLAYLPPIFLRYLSLHNALLQSLQTSDLPSFLPL